MAGSSGPRAGSFLSAGGRTASLGAAALLGAGCESPPPDDLGPRDDGLRPCDPVATCVHTGQVHPEDYPPFRLAPAWRERDPQEVRRELAGAVAALPRTEVVARRGPYLHAEARSRLLRRVDDLELYWEPEDQKVVVRSEARAGRSDLGRNLRRVEALRQSLLQRGVLD